MPHELIFLLFVLAFAGLLWRHAVDRKHIRELQQEATNAFVALSLESKEERFRLVGSTAVVERREETGGVRGIFGGTADLAVTIYACNEFGETFLFKNLEKMLQILGRASSINVRKVLWTCAELNIHPEHIEWGAGDLSLASPGFLALNPAGLIPVLVDDGLTLSESNTICRYLAGKQSRTDLLPDAPAPRARVEQWMDWQATELNNAWRYAFMGLVRQSSQFQDPSLIDASVLAWNRQMGLVNDALAKGGPYLMGSALTLADIVVGLATHRWYSTPMQRPNLRAVEAYYERLSERPGFMAHGRNGMP